jgi:ribonuclease PH
VALALQPLIDAGELPPEVLARQIAAISVGLVDGVPLLDLAYDEDVRAEVDFNVVMAGDDQLVEVQGTAEKAPFARTQLDELVDLAAAGIVQLQDLQNAVIGKQ